MSTSGEQEFLKMYTNLNETQYDNVPNSPRVFISYSHDSNKHKENVFRLSEHLRREGVDCNIDQYETSPLEGWIQWMINQIEEADFVLIVCTENYEKRFKGKDEIGKGRGVKWEGAIITQELYYSEANNKCIPIVFSPEDSEYIPSILKSATYYVLNMEEINDETYDELYARLTYQKLVIKPDIGELRLITPKYCSSSVSTQKEEGEIAESNQKPVIGELRTITTKSQSPKIHETFTSPSNEKIEKLDDLNSRTQFLNFSHNLDNKERTFVSRFSNFQIPPPSNWQDFESLCCDLWREIWEDPNTKKNGRQGQPQNGVDIYGRHHKGNLWSGIQCKCKNNDLNRNLTESEVYNEVQKAKKSLPKLSEFIIATTGPKDARIEEFARKITHEHLKEGLFSVDIWGWDDIKEYLDNFPSIRSKYYPEININLDDIKRKENDNHFKRENAGKIIEKVIRPLRNCAKYIKPYFKNGDYILNLENKAINLNLKFNGYEFIQICEESNRFRLKDENLVFTYKKDEILNRSISRIISYLDNYREHFIALKTAIETLNTSNVPTSFESDIAVLIENESKKYDLAEDERKEEFLFKLYATVVTGKGTFSGHDWATTLKKTKSKEVLKIIKKDPYSNETFTKIEYLNNEIILNIDELINELNNLDEELQNAYCL